MSTMRNKNLFFLMLILSLGIMFLAIPIFRAAYKGETTVQGEPSWTVGVILSLFPIAAFTFLFFILKGRKYKSYHLLLGILLASLAWEFLADPWSVEWRLQKMPEAGLMPVIAYMFIGTAFIILAIFFFRRGMQT